jgi:hypothetical protein
MFGLGRKKQLVATSIDVVKEAERVTKAFIPTVDIINNSKVSYIDLLDRELTTEEAHLKKYLYTLERKSQNDITALDMNFISKCRKADFNLFVRPDCIGQFENAAVVYTIYGSSQVSKDDGLTDIHYVGDIPDFALNKIIDAQNKNIAHCLTIHSNQELAVKYEPFIYRDPVIISWNTAPYIKKHKGIWECDTKNVNIGVVIAMWQDDGQPL